MTENLTVSVSDVEIFDSMDKSHFETIATNKVNTT